VILAMMKLLERDEEPFPVLHKHEPAFPGLPGKWFR